MNEEEINDDGRVDSDAVIEEDITVYYGKPRQNVIRTTHNILQDTSNLLQSISQYYNKESLSDIIFKVSERQFYAHRFVLAQSSDVFRTMLFNKPWQADDVIELHETPECVEVFDKFMNFFYTATVTVDTDSCVEILYLADKYNVMSLRNLCVEYMFQNSRPPQVTNAVKWYPCSKIMSINNLEEQCLSTIAWNLSHLVRLPQWLNINIDDLQEILQSDEIMIGEEYDLYTSVSTWLLLDERQQNLRHNSEKLLRFVRFARMTPSDLYSVEKSRLMLRPECKEIVWLYLSEAYRIRALGPIQQHLDSYFLSRGTYIHKETINKCQAFCTHHTRADVSLFPDEEITSEWKITHSRGKLFRSVMVECRNTKVICEKMSLVISVVIAGVDDGILLIQHAPTWICISQNATRIEYNINDLSNAYMILVHVREIYPL